MRSHSSDTAPLAASSLAAGVLLVVLSSLTLITGVSQQAFEIVRAPEPYAAALVRDATWLRAIIAIDDVFIAAYVTATVLLGTMLARRRFEPIHVLIIAGGVAGGVLDLEENHHILAMLRMAENGLAIPIEQILRRTDLSQLKWMLGHLAFVLVGVAIAGRGSIMRSFRFSLIAVQLPLGALCWAVSSPTWQPVLFWARYLSFVSGFFLVAWLTRPNAETDVASDAVGSGAPA